MITTDQGIAQYHMTCQRLALNIFELDLTIPKKFAWGIAKCVEHLFATTVAMQLQDSHDAKNPGSSSSHAIQPALKWLDEASKYGWHADASAGVVEKD